MGNVTDNKNYWQAYDWSQGGEEWSEAWGSTKALWHGSLMPRLAAQLPCGHLLEIAPGFGRMTAYLLPHCEQFTAVDISAACIATCKERFATSEHAQFHQNDGRSFSMIEDGSVDFAFSWDSLVHVDQSVISSYLHELSRKLRPGAHAFLHHSNLGAISEEQKAAQAFRNTHGRDEGMSALIFRNACKDAGLFCLSQELLTWAKGILNDCISVCRKPELTTDGEAETERPQVKIHEHHLFQEEAGNLMRMTGIYAPKST